MSILFGLVVFCIVAAIIIPICVVFANPKPNYTFASFSGHVMYLSGGSNNIALNPNTNQPYNFIFVNNSLITNSNTQNGTFEFPYSTLLQAQTNSTIGDIIYVFYGDGNNTGMNAGIILQNNQYFWSSGVTHDLVTS